MKKVYSIEYRECDYEGRTLYEKAAFTSYRAASHFLLTNDYKVEPITRLDYQTKTYTYDLNFEHYEIIDEEMDYKQLWRAVIHELFIAE